MHFHSLILLFSFCLSSSFLVNVKIIKESTTLRNELTHNSHEIKRSKTNASNFSGPSDLRQLVGQCFTHSTDKYNYKVCPFDNITQHERLWNGIGYNGIIGIWKEWKVVNNTFDSLMYYNGDDCDEKLERSARMIFICDEENKVINISEPEKCKYEITFASNFGCEQTFIYPHLDRKYRDKWDSIETNYFYGELTPFGYQTFLNELFVETGILINKTYLINSNKIDFENKDKCIEKVVLLQKENLDLLKRIQILEKELNKK